MATPSSSKNSSRRAFGAALIFHNESKPDAVRTLKHLRALLKARGVPSWLAGARPSAEAIRRADFAIALGGDGTMLRVAREVAPRGIPLLGVNVGTLGFLSGTEAGDLKRRLDAVISGRFIVEERSMLTAETLRDGRRVFGPDLALNEVVIRCGDQARAITLSTRSGERFVADFFGDGLIVATPTGSTAYSLAASGPIVDPSLDVTLLAPICPHTLTQRPLIVPAHLPLSIRLTPRRAETPRVLVSLDGRPGCELKVGDEVRVRRAETPLRLLLPPGRSFFEVLRRKLKWGGCDMLRRLKVANFAVVERVELELPAGFVAFTGETGAGKSILLEALGFLLGARGSSSWLRTGADRLEVEGVFDAADLPAELRERYKVSAGVFVARRELDAAGKTRAMIHAQSAPVAALAALGDAFADFHGQHEHQALMRPAVQLELLDRYAGLEAEREALAAAHASWSALTARLAASSMSEEERRRRVELLRFQLEEIVASRPRIGEEEELEERLPRLKNAERLRTFADQAYGLLYAEENAALARLMKAERALGELAKIDSGAGRLQGELEAARLAIDAVAHEVGDYRDRATADPAALDALLTRQEALSRLKKRHGPTLADVLATRDRLTLELDGLENSDARIEETRRELAAAEKALSALCEKVHGLRVKAAKRLDAAVLKELKVLGMPHSRFSCSVEMEEGNWSRTGADAVDFLLTANPGEPLRAVKTAASGGELSRVMLALKTAFAKADRTPLLVFDEVDSGIGGEVATAVGEKLAALAKGRQVLCVTHLPQVACHASTHFHVSKEVVSGRTRVRLERLNGDRRLETVALMLGGRAATAASRKHAEELLENSLS